MAASAGKKMIVPKSRYVGPPAVLAFPGEARTLNLPTNADSREQQEILDALPVLVLLERGGHIVFANAEARRAMGLTEGEWVPRPVEDLIWGLNPGTAEPQTTLTSSGSGSAFHATLPGVSGHLQQVEGTYSLLSAERREAVIVAHPSSRERTPKPQLMDDVLASLPEAVAIEHGTHVLYTNPAFTRMFGYTAEEACGGNLRQLIVPETRLNELTQVERVVEEQGRATMETVRTNKAGELVDVSMQCAPLLVNGARLGRVYTFRDIGDRKETEAKLQHDAMHDTLTGLPNRALFLDRLGLAMSRRLRNPAQNCGVLFIDLDGFKEVNDLLGHAAGDMLLVGMSQRLRLALRPQDSAARLGGDEFGVVVEGISSTGDLEAVASRIAHELRRPFEIFGHPVQSGASIGAAIATAEHTGPEMLVRDADYAMYQAKQSGGGRYQIFDRHMEVNASGLQERTRALREAMDQRQVDVCYEPVYRLETGALESFNTQLFRRRPDGSLDSFEELLQVAEETGLSITLGRETLESACRQLRSWSDRLPYADFTLTVGLTQRQFYHADLLGQLQKALADSGADPRRLRLEVQESALNENPDAAVVIVQRLMDNYVRVSVGSFGAALAPLNHLVRLPVEMVKLDAKLTAAATSGGRQQAVLEALIGLGRTLGVHMVAQGIETVEQLNALYRMGCDLGQGPLLSRALEEAHAFKLAELGRWATVGEA